MFCIALGGIWASAYPDRAKQIFRFWSEAMSDARFYWLCIALVFAYAIMWWITSLEPKSRRQKIQAGLNPHYQKMAQIFSDLRTAPTDEEFNQCEARLDGILTDCLQWIADNMSPAALEDIGHPTISGGHWTWSGTHDSELIKKRNSILSWQGARMAVLDKFLMNDAWDGDAPTIIQRLKRKYRKWKA
jgi:hypothetical protein